jgi:hypothetical protein
MKTSNGPLFAPRSQFPVRFPIVIAVPVGPSDPRDVAGYSDTPLVKKLGIKENHRLVLVGAPRGFERTLGELPRGVRLTTSGRFDVAVAFCTRESEVEKRLAALKARMDPAGGIWIAWPKKASKMSTDVSENVVRKHGLASKLVDNKVCAVDDTWSGLRLVMRVVDRPKQKTKR